MGKVALITVLIAGKIFAVSGAEASDSWKRLQDTYAAKPLPDKGRRPGFKQDPWAKLRAIYLPFTEAQEQEALSDTKARHRVSGHFTRVLAPYSEFIEEAASRFTIPKEIIAAVIMVESGGDPGARADTSTASGLMQTIDGTFSLARKNLSGMGVPIRSTPFDPHASIMAGSWYLDRMFEQATSDQKPGVENRQKIDSWRYPLEYYYAGPGNGKKERSVVIIYANGRRLVVDKAAYSRKVLRWAKIMKKNA